MFKFREIWQREIDKAVRYLPHRKKTEFRLAVQLSLLRGYRLKSARAAASDNLLTTESAPNFIQMGPFSAELYLNARTSSQSAPK